MAIKQSNEITVRVIGSDEALINKLREKGFQESRRFTLDDYYFIPNSIDIMELSPREILSKAVIIRYIVDENQIIQKITYKIKEINEDGEIINQKIVQCSVLSIEEAKTLFESLGYYEIMNIKESDIVYEKDGFEIAVKFIENSNTLLEVETSPKFDTIESLKNKIEEIGLPIQEGIYFVKKAEERLEKIIEALAK